MKVFISTDHDYIYPVGVCSVIVAETHSMAIELLDIELIAEGLQPYAKSPYTLVEVDLTSPSAKVLLNGDY